jgi:16S rRNA (adenine1518-N6/adenine1519-N6)-dimethyltransferase
MQINHDSITEIRALLQMRGIALKKRFGQNFLIVPEMRQRIAETITSALAEADRDREELPDSEIWEIGPGLGSLTDALIARGFRDRLRLFEIDRGIIDILKERYGPAVALEEGDVMRTFPRVVEELTATGASVAERVAVIAGNLPYNSAGAIIPALVEFPVPVARMVFLLQQEMVDRLSASPGSKQYAAISVLIQSHYTVKPLFSVSPGCFYPVPQVKSMVALFQRREDAPDRETTAMLSKLARLAFAQRRKTLRTTLSGYHEPLALGGIEAGLRGEVLSPEDYRRLAGLVISQSHRS